MATVTLDDATDAVYADAVRDAKAEGVDVVTFLTRLLGRPLSVDPAHRPDPDEPFGYDDGGFPVYLPAGQASRLTA